MTALLSLPSSTMAASGTIKALSMLCMVIFTLAVMPGFSFGSGAGMMRRTAYPTPPLPLCPPAEESANCDVVLAMVSTLASSVSPGTAENVTLALWSLATLVISSSLMLTLTFI